MTLTARDIAALHGVSKRTAQRWLRKGAAAGSLAVVEAQATGGNHFIETVWGRGYVLRDPDPRVAAATADKAA